MITRFLLRYPYLIWLSGMLLPYMYLTYLLNLNRVLSYFRRANITIILLISFVFVQLLSASLSISYDFFSLERLIAIFHNIFAFTFILVGYAFMQDIQLNKYIKKYTSQVFVFVFLLILISTIYSLVFNEALEFPSFFSAIGFDNKFSAVKFNMLDWYLFSNFPRTQVLGIYPNSTGLLLIFLYSVVVSLNINGMSTRKMILFTIMLILACFLTGSRTYLLLSCAYLFLLGIKNKRNLTFISLCLPFLIVLIIVAIEFLLTLRIGSNNARIMIYQGSFNFMMETNPIFGIGIKPRLPDLIGLPYPLGSHSTLWGYIIKCGLVGFLFVLVFVTVPLYRYFRTIILQILTKVPFDKQDFFIQSSFLIVIIALSMEDLDAFETLPLYFGMILWIYDNRKTFRKN